MGKASKRKVASGSGDMDSFKKFKEGSDDVTDPKLRSSVDRDLKAVREAALEARDGPQPVEDETAEAEEESAGPADPYLLADAKYIQKDTRWRNKQRTLVFCSRGVTSRFRHLTEDIRKMLPHHKSEPKFEKTANLHDINEVCELKSCNNVIFFEARKMTDLYMYIARVPAGPTLKFQVLNIHTTGEVRLAGNCLLGSRPILHFDKHFDELAELKLTKTLLIQALGTPRNHPKCKPFHDHLMQFTYLDNKIWFRHYQIAPETQHDNDDPEKQTLTEIGPRFVLDPIRFLTGSFSGQTMYANPRYMSPTALRVQAKKLLGNPYRRKLEGKADREAKKKENEEAPDPLDEAFV
jgi:ribosome biogenesis protein BRX1